MLIEEYSPYKIIHHPDKLNELRERKQCVPLQIHFVPTNCCNQSCSFCAYRLKYNPSNEDFHSQDQLSYEKARECINCFAELGIKAVQFTGGGEPLAHPQIASMFRDTLDNNMDLALVSNGMALTDELIEILTDATWVRISVDAGTAITYSSLRMTKESNFDLVIQNIRKLIQTKKKNGIIGIGFVVNKDNYKEIYEAAKIFRDLGVDNFRVSAALTPEGYNYFAGFESEARDLSAKAASLSDDHFTVFNLFNDRIEDVFVGKQDYPRCYFKDLVTYVAADYNVYTCCTLAYNKKGLIGSFKDQSFTELWLSDSKVKIFSKHDPKKVCQTPCLFKNKNEFIDYCVREQVKHSNFI